MIKSTMDACEASGMPLSHARAFQRVANRVNCVISSRSVGKWATGLILENYTSKGFHVKAKTCDWGPMAGFVLSDPRFTKRGVAPDAREAQRKDVHNAVYKEHAGEMQIFLTDNRRQFLENKEKGCIVRSGGNINEMVYTGTTKDGSYSMRFVLRREFNGPGARGLQLWAVFYDSGETSLPSSPAAPNRPVGTNLLPVMGLVDPHCPTELKNTYRAAMTGDYDLWAVFPAAGEFEHGGADKRPVPGSHRYVVPGSIFSQHEHKDEGNITPRVRSIRHELNAAIQSAGYTGGEMVHHSDEAGRPFVSEVELQFIAFIPGQPEARFIANSNDLQLFMAEVVRGYHITFNPGWQRDLGFTATPAGNWEV